MTPLQRLALACYPKRMRSRYGDELAAATDATGSDWRVTADLARGALAAWMRPSYRAGQRGRRERLEATTATVFVAWCVSLLCGAAFGKAVNDSPVPGLHAWGATAFDAATNVMWATAAAVLAVGFVHWAAIVVDARRGRDHSVLVPAILPGAIVGGWIVATLAFALLTRSSAVPQRAGSGVVTAASGLPRLVALGLFFLWGAITVAAVAACATSAVSALRRSRLGEAALARTVSFAGLCAVALAVQASESVLCLARVLAVGGLGALSGVEAVVSVALLVTAAGAALCSSARGLRRLRPAQSGYERRR